MKILKKLFGKAKNPLLVKFDNAVKFRFESIYYLFGFHYTQENYLKFKTLLEKNDFQHMKRELEFDVNQDNIETYLTIDEYGVINIFLIIDYYEPLMYEKVLEKIQIECLPEIEMAKLK